MWMWELMQKARSQLLHGSGRIISTISVPDARIISKANGVNDSNHFWMLSSIDTSEGTRLRFRLKTNGLTSTLIASSGTLQTVWTHAAAVYDGIHAVIQGWRGMEIWRRAGDRE